MENYDDLISYYLDTVTVGYFNNNDFPPDSVNGYYNEVEAIRRKAIKHGDLLKLEAALNWLLGNRAIDLEIYNGGRYPFDETEMKEILLYIRDTLFPDEAT